MDPESKDFTQNADIWADRINGRSKEQSAQNTPELTAEAHPASNGTATAARQAIPADPLLTGGKTPPTMASEPVAEERRRTPRYQCEGSLELKTEDSTLHTWATFTDVCLGGCYVEIATTFPVGTIMDMQLGMHGFTVNTRGVVQVTYPFLGMGIEFTDASPEDRVQLDLMLTSLAAAFANRWRKPEPEGLKMPPITEPGAVVDALAKFFAEKPSLTSNEFLRLVQDSQQRNM